MSSYAWIATNQVGSRERGVFLSAKRCRRKRRQISRKRRRRAALIAPHRIQWKKNARTNAINGNKQNTSVLKRERWVVPSMRYDAKSATIFPVIRGIAGHRGVLRERRRIETPVLRSPRWGMRGERGAHVRFEEGARPLLAGPQFHFLNEASQPPGRSGRLGLPFRVQRSTAIESAYPFN